MSVQVTSGVLFDSNKTLPSPIANFCSDFSETFGGFKKFYYICSTKNKHIMYKKRNQETLDCLNELVESDKLTPDQQEAVRKARNFYEDNTYVDYKERDAFYAREMEDYVNSTACDEKKFADCCGTFHRTLQQSFMRVIVKTIKKFSTLSTDGRNERAVNLAKKLNSVIEDDGGYLPFV